MGIGTLEVHPIDLLGALRHDRQQRRADAAARHQLDRRRGRPHGLAARRPDSPRASRSSAARRPTSSPTSWPATPTRRSTRSGASGRSTTARPAARPPTRPARRATTRTWRPTATSRRRRTRRHRPWPSGSGWATATARPNDGKLSLDTSAPLWSAILTEVSRGEKIAQFKPPPDHRRPPPSTRSPGSSPARSRPRRSRNSSCRAPSRRRRRRSARRPTIDKATGLLWQDGCQGPKVTRGFFDLREVEANFPAWQKANAAWGARAARGSGVRGGPKGTRTSYFYNGAFAPFGRTWGAPFMPTRAVPEVHAAGVLRSVRHPAIRSRPAAADAASRPDARPFERPAHTPRRSTRPKPPKATATPRH